MKKSLGIILALMLVLGALFVPLTFTASAELTPFSGTYTFNFGEDRFNYSTYNTDSAWVQTSYEGINYYPLHNYDTGSSSVTASGKTTVGYEAITVGETTVDALKIDTTALSGRNNFTVLTLMKDGSPIQLSGGKTYNIDVTFYVTKNNTNTREIYFGYGNTVKGVEIQKTSKNLAQAETKGSFELTVNGEAENNFFQICIGSTQTVWITSLTITGQTDGYNTFGLVSHYNISDNTGSGFNAESTVWADLAGDNDFTVNLDSDNYFTKGGYHLYNNYVELPVSLTDLINAGTFTVEVALGEVVNNAANEKDYNAILGSTNDKFNIYRQVSNDRLYVKANDGSGARPYVGDAAATIKNTTIAVTYEFGEVCAIYINGILQSSKTPTATAIGADVLRIGYTADQRQCEVTYRAIRFYNRVLTAEELVANAALDSETIDNSVISYKAITVDYIENKHFSSTNQYYYATRGSVIYYPGKEVTLSRGSNKYFHTWESVAVFDWDSTQKCYVLSVLHKEGSAVESITIPATGFAVGIHTGNLNNNPVGAELAAHHRMVAAKAINDNMVEGTTKAYLYGIDLYEGYLDTSIDKTLYTDCKNDDKPHMNDENYQSNAFIVIDSPLTSGTPFNPEEEPVQINIDYNYGGASILTDTAAEIAGHQAMRVYYSYKLNDNGKIDAGETEYALKERGILIANITNLNKNITVENVGDNIIRLGKTEDFDKCWFFDSNSNTRVYSNYITGFEFTDIRRLKFRGYIILDDGTESGKIVYSDTVSTSVVEISGDDIADDYSYNENYQFPSSWTNSVATLQSANYDFAFGVQTDTHFALGDTTNSSYPHTGYSISALSRVEGVSFDYIVNLGDLLKGYEDPVMDNKFNMLQSAKALDRRFTTATACPVLYAVGNHDNNIMWARVQEDENELITKKELYDIFGKSVQNTTSNSAVFDGESMYYYVDFPEKGIRAIMLDTNDFADGFAGILSSSTISDKQLAWFRDVALNTNYSVIVMSHVPFIVEDGFNKYKVNNSEGVLAATDSFKARGGEIIGFFYGHLHEQAATVRNGDNHIIFRNGGRYAEVVTVDTENKTINTIGFGTQNRTFSYKQETEIKFSLFADFHYKEGMYLSSIADMQSIIDRGVENNVDFIMHAGDFCNDYIGSPELTNTYLTNNPLSAYGIYGNHELESNNNSMQVVTPLLTNRADGVVWGTASGKIEDGSIGYYYFDNKGFRIICLDTNYSLNSTTNEWEHNPTASSGRPSSNTKGHSLGTTQLAWFKEVLNDTYTKGLSAIVMSHSSIYYGTPAESKEIKDLFKELNGKRVGTVLMAINGHYHTNATNIADGVLYFDCNTVRNNLWLSGQTEQHYTTETFNFVSYDENGNMLNTEEKLITSLSGAKSTWFSDTPLNAVITVNKNGQIVIDGATGNWLGGVDPGESAEEKNQPTITSGNYDVIE